MKKIELYQVDAFTDALFKGNPAAVCPLDSWLSEELMQNIALENNLSETAFYVQKGDVFEIRWFTPTHEIDLCGHATIATAFVEFFIKKNTSQFLKFVNTKKQNLEVSLKGELLELDFPIEQVKAISLKEELKEPFNHQPLEAYVTNEDEDVVLVFENASQIQNLIPNFNLLTKLDYRGILVTAKGDDTDIVCRFFAPNYGINEDPVTGYAHTILIPFWSKRLNTTKITSQQLSKRTGMLFCELHGERVKIAGKAKLYLKGEIEVHQNELPQ